MKAIERIIQYIDFKGINNSSFEKKISVSNGYLATQLKRNADLGEGVLLKILNNCLEISPEWLLTGKGKMLRGEKQAPKEYIVNEGSSIYVKENRKKLIPLVSWEAVAGFGNARFSIGQEDVQEQYLVPDFKEIDFMIRLRGSSMYPKYSAGDIVACRIIKESQFIQWNKTYVVATAEQGIICKRLKKSQVPDCYLAVSDNKDYEPFELPHKEVTGIALIVGVIRLE